MFKVKDYLRMVIVDFIGMTLSYFAVYFLWELPFMDDLWWIIPEPFDTMAIFATWAALMVLFRWFVLTLANYIYARIKVYRLRKYGILR